MKLPAFSDFKPYFVFQFLWNSFKQPRLDSSINVLKTLKSSLNYLQEIVTSRNSYLWLDFGLTKNDCSIYRREKVGIYSTTTPVFCKILTNVSGLAIPGNFHFQDLKSCSHLDSCKIWNSYHNARFKLVNWKTEMEKILSHSVESFGSPLNTPSSMNPSLFPDKSLDRKKTVISKPLFCSLWSELPLSFPQTYK